VAIIILTGSEMPVIVMRMNNIIVMGMGLAGLVLFALSVWSEFQAEREAKVRGHWE
jgi:hypothetical protein